MQETSAKTSRVDRFHWDWHFDMPSRHVVMSRSDPELLEIYDRYCAAYDENRKEVERRLADGMARHECSEATFVLIQNLRHRQDDLEASIQSAIERSTDRLSAKIAELEETIERELGISVPRP